MFGRAVDATPESPGQADRSADGASANRSLRRGDDPDHPADRWRNATSLGLAARMDAFRRGNARAVLDTQSAETQKLSERAAELEKAAERFRLSGDEKAAASFAEQAAALRRAGA